MSPNGDVNITAGENITFNGSFNCPGSIHCFSPTCQINSVVPIEYEFLVVDTKFTLYISAISRLGNAEVVCSYNGSNVTAMLHISFSTNTVPSIPGSSTPTPTGAGFPTVAPTAVPSIPGPTNGTNTTIADGYTPGRCNERCIAGITAAITGITGILTFIIVLVKTKKTWVPVLKKHLPKLMNEATLNTSGSSGEPPQATTSVTREEVHRATVFPNDVKNDKVASRRQLLRKGCPSEVEVGESAELRGPQSMQAMYESKQDDYTPPTKPEDSLNGRNPISEESKIGPSTTVCTQIFPVQYESESTVVIIEQPNKSSNTEIVYIHQAV